MRKLIPIFAVIIVAALALYWWHARAWESTDDAQIDGNIYPISARIAGHVARVNIQNGQYVQAGTVLVEIDPTDYQVALQKSQADFQDAAAAAKAAGLSVPLSAAQSRSDITAAEAEVANAQASQAAAQQQVHQAQAQVNEAQATARKANSDLQRYSTLVQKKEISQQQYDQAVAAADAANARVTAAQAALNSAQAQVRQADARLNQAQAMLLQAQVSPKSVAATQQKAQSASAQVQRAQANLQQAQLDLSYTKIIAPVDGVIGSRSVQVGQNLQPGQALMALVPLQDLWVTANFKETQLRNMHAGQEAEIDVDAYGNTVKGHVTSLGAATGARFSLLPPENATGNYVKVVQRVPVRIDLEKGTNADRRLRPGMSVDAKVQIR